MGRQPKAKRRGTGKWFSFLMEIPTLGYHAGALAYSFLLSAVPMALFFTTLLSFLPTTYDLSEVLVDLENIFPGVTHKIVSQFLSLKPYGYSLVSLILTLFFTSSFVRNLERAMTIVSSGSDHFLRGGRVSGGMVTKALNKVRVGGIPLSSFSHVLLTLVLSFLFLLSLILIFTFGSLFRSFKPLKENLIQVVIVALNLAFVYRFLLPFRQRTSRILMVSFGIAILLIVLKYLFLIYSRYWLSHTLVYGTMAYLLLFLIWLNLTFYLLLIGARMLAYRGMSR